VKKKKYTHLQLTHGIEKKKIEMQNQIDYQGQFAKMEREIAVLTYNLKVEIMSNCNYKNIINALTAVYSNIGEPETIEMLTPLLSDSIEIAIDSVIAEISKEEGSKGSSFVDCSEILLDFTISKSTDVKINDIVKVTIVNRNDFHVQITCVNFQNSGRFINLGARSLITNETESITIEITEDKLFTKSINNGCLVLCVCAATATNQNVLTKLMGVAVAI